MNLKAWILMHLDSDVVRSSAKHCTLRNYSHVTPLEIELLDRSPVTSAKHTGFTLSPVSHS